MEDNRSGYHVCIGGRLDHISGGYSYGPFMRDFYTLDYCTRGGFTVWMGTGAVPVREGQLHVIPPNTPIRHEFTAEVTSSVYIGVKGTALAHHLRLLGFSEDRIVFPHSLSPRALEYFQHLVDSLEIREHQSNEFQRIGHKVTFLSNPDYSDHLGTEAELRQSGWLSLFLAELTRIRGSSLPSPVKQAPQQAYVDAAVRYIESNYHLDITVEGIAAHVGLTRSYLFKLFREYLGVSVNEYIIRTRIRAACDFLRLPGAQVKTVAASVGCEPCNFSKLFKKTLGISPGEYRRQHTCNLYNEFESGNIRDNIKYL